MHPRHLLRILERVRAEQGTEQAMNVRPPLGDALVVRGCRAVELGLMGAAPAHSIVGGTTADAADHAYHVKGNSSTFVCGGSFIADAWVWTAAHCVDHAVHSPGSVQVANH